jgi:hypothetical protein
MYSVLHNAQKKRQRMGEVGNVVIVRCKEEIAKGRCLLFGKKKVKHIYYRIVQKYT